MNCILYFEILNLNPGGRARWSEDRAGDHLGDRLGRLLLLHLEGGQVDWKGCITMMICCNIFHDLLL